MRKRAMAAVLGVGLGLVAEPASAIPAFARRYGVDCHFCHDIYPKLNAMGQRFKERGFRMEREEAFDIAQWARTVPLSVRGEGYRLLIEEGDDSSFAYFKGISAGNLGERLSYWVDDGVVIREGEDNFGHVKPNNAWARVEIVRGGGLYAKGGRFELDLPFTQTRTPHALPYDIYFANTGSETDGIGVYQQGVEVGGEFRGDVHWSAALVQRRNRGDDVSRFGNVFLRASKRLGRNRIGGFAWFGKSQIDEGPGLAVVDGMYRVGGDANLWLSRLNLYGLYLFGRNDSSFPTAPGQALTFHGGFAQGDYRLSDPLAVTLRFNVVNRQASPSSSRSWQTSLVPGAQVWLVANRLRLSFEYAFQDNGRSDFGAVQADIAF
jgi:hypothetical protein